MPANRLIEDGTRLVKKHGVKTVVGLNAAAIIFLYSTFATQKDHSALQAWVKTQQDQVTALQSRVSFLEGELNGHPLTITNSPPARGRH